MQAWLKTALVSAVCFCCLGAANYYERVELGAGSYSDLAVLAKAGYIDNWQQPEFSMLRLEFAMLLQTALPRFEAAEQAGTASTESTAAARRLLKEFRPELDGIGGYSSAADPPGAQPSSSSRVDEFELDAHGAAADEEAALLIGEELLSDEWSEAAPSAQAAQQQQASSVGLDDLVQQAAAPPAAMNAVPLPQDSSWRPQGHDPASFVAAEEPNSTQAAAAEAGPEPAELPVVRPPSGAGSAAEAPARAGLDPPTRVPAPTPRPYGSSTDNYAGRDLNFLLDEREREQQQAALSAERESPGPQASSYVADAQLSPGHRYRQQIDVEVKPFIDAQGQFSYRNADGTSVSGNSSDLRLYWADAGLDFMHEDWQARVALNFNDRSAEPKLHELWAEFRDSESGLYGRAGRSILPFATRKGWFPTFSYSRELGFSTANTAGIGWNKPGWGASVWVYDAPVEDLGGGSSSLDELAFNLSLMSEPDAASDSSWRLALAYLSELGGHERRLAAGPLAASVPGFNLSAGYSWDDGLWSLALDLTSALDAYNSAALDTDANGSGDKPSALALELIYAPDGLRFWGLRSERTTQFGSAAGTRWSLLYGQWLSEQMLGRLELSRASYNAHTPGRTRDLSLTADLNLVF